MSKTAIISTSTSNLTRQADSPDIHILPLHVLIEGKDLLDGIHISPERLQQWMLKHPDRTASTAPPSLEEIRALFDTLIADGYTQVLAITLSSRISQSYNHLHQVGEEYRNRLDVHIFDTLSGGPCEALLVQEAQRQLQRGAAMAGIITRLKLLRDNTRTFLAIGKLDYLVRSGRLSAPAGFLGDLLKLHPVLHVQDGAIKPLHRVRTLERALEEMARSAAHFARNELYEWHIIQSGVPQASQLLQDIMLNQYDIRPASVVPMTSVLSAHAGNDSVGLLIWPQLDTSSLR